MIRPLSRAAALALTLSACAAAPDGTPEVARAVPPDATPGVCYGRDVSPAVIETVTELVMVRPAELAADGSVLTPEVYQTQTHQAIVREREELWFETPSEHDMTPDFIASVQRALAVRGYYGGPVNGRVTEATRRALRSYQAERGLDSAVISIETARELGLAAYVTEASS